MLGTDIDVKPSEINLADKRKLLHTPKSGLIIPEGADFYKEQIEDN